VGDNWTPLNAGTGSGDSDWADYYHAEFHGFNVVYTTSPAGDVTADSYFSTKGWSTANSDASNYNTGHVYEEDVYSGNNANGKILRTTLYQYTGTCHVDNNTQGCTTYPNSCHGSYNATYNPCEVMVLWSKTFDLEGNGTYQTNTSAPLVETDYTYDDFNPKATTASGLQSGYHNLLEEDIIPSNAPEVKKFWTYVTHDTTTSLPWTYYIVNTVAHSEIDDTSGHIYQCQYITYDEGASSPPSAGWPTTVSQYDNNNCKGQTNPLVTTYKGYDGYGNVVATVDGTAVWAAANGNNLYGSNGSGAGCSASPAYKTSHWSSNYTTCTTYDSYNAQPASVTQSASGTVNLTTSFTYDDNQGRLPISTTDANSQQTTTSYSYDSTGNSIVKVSQPGETANYTTKSKTNTQCATTLPPNGNTFASPCFQIDSFVSQYSNTVSQTFYDSQGREVETSTPVIPPANADQTKTYFRVVITAYDDSTHSVWKSEPFVVASSTTVSSVKAVGWIDPGVLNGNLKDYNGDSVYGTATYDDALGRTIAVDDPIFNAGGSSGISCPSYGANTTSCAVYSTGTITLLVSSDSNTYAITTSIDPNNHVQLTYSDALGRTRYVQFDSGTNSGTLSAEELKTIQYNILNEPTSVQVTDLAPHNNQTIKVITTTAQYDDLGRMTSLTDPDRGTHTYSYDPDGHVIGDTSGAHILGYSYDLAGRLGCLQDTAVTATTVNASGSCGPSVNPFVINTYDADPGGVTWDSADYPKGRLTQSFAINYFPAPDYSQGKVTQNMQYDLRGRLITERQSETVTGGSLILPALPQNQMTLTYNDANQLMMTQTTVGGSTSYTFSQAYDSKTGMPIGLSNNNNGVANLATLGYFYNSQGLTNTLNFLSSADTALASENFSYDGDLRPAGGNATWQSGSGTSGTIFSQGIGYDAASNVLSQTLTMSAISGQSGSGGSETQNFCYDELNRLTWASNSSATPAAGSGTCGSVALQGTLGGSYTNTFKYTNLGQIWKGTLNGSGTYQYLYCNNNTHQLTAVTTTTPPSCSNQGSPAYTASYDSWGNVTGRTYNGVTSTLSYDGQDHLVRWNGSSNQEEWYWYDATGNRVMTRSTTDGTNMTLTVYAFGLEEHQYTYSGSGSATNTANTSYYTLSGRLLGVLSGLSSQSTSFLLTDLLGSVVTSFSTTAGSAAVQGNQAYGPFGNQRYSVGNLNSASNSSLTNKGYTGQYDDPLSGLDYYNARYYDPVVGLFLSADKKQGNPRGMNPYAYVGDNPETETDPTGQYFAPPPQGNGGPPPSCDQLSDCWSASGGNGNPNSGTNPPSNPKIRRDPLVDTSGGTHQTDQRARQIAFELAQDIAAWRALIGDGNYWDYAMGMWYLTDQNNNGNFFLGADTLFGYHPIPMEHSTGKPDPTNSGHAEQQVLMDWLTNGGATFALVALKLAWMAGIHAVLHIVLFTELPACKLCKAFFSGMFASGISAMGTAIMNGPPALNPWPTGQTAISLDVYAKNPKVTGGNWLLPIVNPSELTLSYWMDIPFVWPFPTSPPAGTV
jgi:RHS repeat-associated protein